MTLSWVESASEIAESSLLITSDLETRRRSFLLWDEGGGDASSSALNEAQAARFLAAARETERDAPYSALWHLLLQVGLRPSEAFGLDWKDVLDLDGPEPKVRVRRKLTMNRRTEEQGERREAAGWRFEPPKTKSGRREVLLPKLAAQERRSEGGIGG